jgi:peptidoglycan/LPS O-acetylase OafA/YrhL
VAAAEVLLWLSLFGLVVLSANPAASSLEIPFGRYLLPWMPLLAVLAIVSAPVSPVLGRALGAPPLAWLGVVSYGVYIFHVPVMQFVRRLILTGPMDSTGQKIQLAIVCLCATAAAAAVSYVLLERPIARLTRRQGPA